MTAGVRDERDLYDKRTLRSCLERWRRSANYGVINAWMNRFAAVQHLIARIKFFHLGARLDTKKHAA
jgi:hypothetical protein